MSEQLRQEITWAIRQWQGKMTAEELAQAIYESPAMVDLRKKAELWEDHN